MEIGARENDWMNLLLNFEVRVREIYVRSCCKISKLLPLGHSIHLSGTYIIDISGFWHSDMGQNVK